jgi:predicted metal-dependent hydrolase
VTAAEGSGDGVERGLREAVGLFNAGEYHAAHERLDLLWEAGSGLDSDFLKGLIQACVCMHHFQRDNLEGAAKLYSGHRRYLAAYLPAHRDVDVAQLLAEMQRVLRPVVRAQPGRAASYDPAERPRIDFAG